MPSQDTSPFFSKQKNTVVDHPFSSHGRFNRLSYIAWYGLLNFIFLAAVIALSLILGLLNFSTLSLNAHVLDTFSGFASLGYFVLFILYLNFNVVIIIRRLHDRNHSGWLCLLLFLPLINFCLALYLLFAKGNPYNNEYGHPRPATLIEKMIAWIMIIFSALSILMTASLLSYFVGTGQLENPNEIIQQSTEYF